VSASASIPGFLRYAIYFLSFISASASIPGFIWGEAKAFIKTSHNRLFLPYAIYFLSFVSATSKRCEINLREKRKGLTKQNTIFVSASASIPGFLRYAIYFLSFKSASARIPGFI
jgi:hypothetical protein